MVVMPAARVLREMQRIERCKSIASDLTDLERELSETNRAISNFMSVLRNDTDKLVEWTHDYNQETNPGKKRTIKNKIDDLNRRLLKLEKDKESFEQKKKTIERKIDNLKTSARLNRCNLT